MSLVTRVSSTKDFLSCNLGILLLDYLSISELCVSKENSFVIYVTSIFFQSARFVYVLSYNVSTF